MAKQRYINTHFWDDSYVVNLDPIEKLLFLYFITNPLTTIAGTYEISLRRIAFDTGIDSEMVKKILSRFENAEKIIYRDGWIFIVNFIKNQSLNPKIIKGIEEVAKDTPQWITDRILKAMDSLSKPSIYSNSNTNSNSNASPAPPTDAKNVGLLIYREFYPHYKLTPYQEDLLTTVENTEAMRRAMKLWASKGYLERNIGGILDVYKKECAIKPSADNPATISDTYDEEEACILAIHRHNMERSMKRAKENMGVKE